MNGFNKYDTYSVASSIYCYKDSTVLRNKFDIRDANKLRKIETDISTIRQNNLLDKPINGRFSPNHLCQIHKYLLGDVYSFAGHYRNENIAKDTTRFLNHTEIKSKISALLKELSDENFLADFDFERFVERAAHYFAERNYIHPFREGNGRAIREFMRLLFDRNGYSVDWSAVSVDALLDAMEDSVYDIGKLISLLHVCLTRESSDN